MMMAALVLTGMSAVAQRPSQEDREARRAEMVQKQAERLAKDFSLKGDAKKSFMDTYVAYQQELQSLGQTNRQRPDRNAQAGQNSQKKELSVEEATKQVDEYFSRQEQQVARQLQRLAVEKEYYAKFKETLTPQQLVKIFVQREQRQGGGQQRGNFGPRDGGQNRGPRGGGFGGGPEGGFESGF